jgi:hypothetical protein
VRADDVIEHKFDSIGYGFGDDFDHDITKGNGTIISRVSGLGILRNQTNESIIKLGRVSPIVEDVEGSVGNITTNNIPVVVKKLGTEPIRSRGRIALKLVNSLVDLISCKLLVENLIHMRVNPVGNTCQMIIKIRRVRGGKNIIEIVHKSVLDSSVISDPVAITIQNEINIIFPFSLRGFEVKKLSIFITTLQPVSLSSLGPPNFLMF